MAGTCMQSRSSRRMHVISFADGHRAHLVKRSKWLVSRYMKATLSLAYCKSSEPSTELARDTWSMPMIEPVSTIFADHAA